MSCGRRWRKTSLAVGWALQRMGRGESGLWIAPSHDIATVGWEMMLGIIKQIPGADKSLSDRRITIGEGTALFRSADSEGGLRGRGHSWFVGDEVAHARNFQTVWEQEIRAALADKKGDGLFISTPKGYNFFYDLWNKNNDEWIGLHYPSWTNPHLSSAEIEAARTEMPELVYRQEFGAEFVQLAGALFRREYFDVVDNVPKMIAMRRFWDIAASVKTSADFSAGVLVGFGVDGCAYILDCVFGRWEWPKLIQIIKNTALSDGQDVYQGIETTGTQRGLLQMLYAEPLLAGITFVGAEAHKDKIVRAMPWLARAEQRLIKLKSGEWNKAWLDNVLAFPEGEHDDITDATSGAFHQLGWREWGKPVVDNRTQLTEAQQYALLRRRKATREGEDRF